MSQVAFQLQKLRRLIKAQGKPFELQVQKTNDFGEPDGKPIAEIIVGVYHETTGYLTREVSGASAIRKKSSPQVLCLYEDAQKVSVDQKLKFNGRTYRVTEVKNLSEMDLACDISLEEVQGDGKQPQV
jgi:hypothetical protein